MSYGDFEFNFDEFNESYEQQKIENVEFNSKVSDDEIVEFLEFKYQIDEVLLAELRNDMADKEKLNEFIFKYREFHNNAGIRIPVLTDMTKEDRIRMMQMFKMSKELHYEAKEAEEILSKITNDQLLIALNEGKKLIGQYDSFNKEPYDDTIKIWDDFPKALDFLNLRLIYLGENGCTLFLHKGIGRGIGLSIGMENDVYTLYKFNEYESWQRDEIKL